MIKHNYKNNEIKLSDKGVLSFTKAIITDNKFKNLLSKENCNILFINDKIIIKPFDIETSINIYKSFKINTNKKYYKSISIVPFCRKFGISLNKNRYFKIYVKTDKNGNEYLETETIYNQIIINNDKKTISFPIFNNFYTNATFRTHNTGVGIIDFLKVEEYEENFNIGKIKIEKINQYSNYGVLNLKEELPFLSNRVSEFNYKISQQPEDKSFISFNIPRLASYQKDNTKIYSIKIPTKEQIVEKIINKEVIIEMENKLSEKDIKELSKETEDIKKEFERIFNHKQEIERQKEEIKNKTKEALEKLFNSSNKKKCIKCNEEIISIPINFGIGERIYEISKCTKCNLFLGLNLKKGKLNEI